MLPTGLIKFDEFELDCARYELRHNGYALKLEKIPMELLMLLATAEGRLASSVDHGSVSEWSQQETDHQADTQDDERLQEVVEVGSLARACRRDDVVEEREETVALQPC